MENFSFFAAYTSNFIKNCHCRGMNVNVVLTSPNNNRQKQPTEVFFKERCCEACNFIKKETLAQVFYCEFCEIFKNTFFIEHLWATASPWSDLIIRKYSEKLFFA